MDYSKVCRICLIHQEKLDDLLDNSQASLLLRKMYNKLIEVKIEPNNGFSSFLCSKCKNDLTYCYQFLEKCCNANKVLQEYIDSQIPDLQNNETVSQKVIEFEKVKQKRNLRLKQYSYEDVNEAIEAARSRFINNTECPKCNFIGSNSRALTIHVSHVHRELKDKWCFHCNSLFESDLRSHLEQHEKENLKCQFCCKKFTKIGHLVEHLRCHTDIRPFKCSECNKCFISARHLRVHKSIHTTNTDSIQSESHEDDTTITIENDEKPLCTICGKQFKTVYKLRVHNRTHTGEAPYKCQQCGKCCTTRNHLVVHERTHTGEKPHVCPTCGKRFAQSSVLRTHLRLHTGRPEACPLCPQRFCRPSELRLHLRRHTGEKPFVCETCGRSFAQRSHLVEHSRTHSDERPYLCKKCGRAFKQASALRAHSQIHDGTKPYICNRCPYACRQRYSLTVHMKQHMEDVSEVYGCGVQVKSAVGSEVMLNVE